MCVFSFIMDQVLNNYFLFLLLIIFIKNFNHNQVLLGLVAVCVSIGSAMGAGAGRAIPIATENFAVELFKGVNSRIVST